MHYLNTSIRQKRWNDSEHNVNNDTLLICVNQMLFNQIINRVDFIDGVTVNVLTEATDVVCEYFKPLYCDLSSNNL